MLIWTLCATGYAALMDPKGSHAYFVYNLRPGSHFQLRLMFKLNTLSIVVVVVAEAEADAISATTSSPLLSPVADV